MSRPPKVPVKEDIRQLTGAERTAVLMLALGEEHGSRVWRMMDEEEIKDISQTMSTLGTISANLVEKLLVEFVSQMSATGSLMGSYEFDRAASHPLHAAGQSFVDHGRNPRSGRPHHVGQARQRERDGSRELSQERISADRRRRAFQDQAGAFRARAGGAAGRIRARSHPAHAAHGIGAEGHPRQGRAHAARRVHVEPRPHGQARRARIHGGNLQQFRPPDGRPFHGRARRAQPRIPPSASRR